MGEIVVNHNDPTWIEIRIGLTDEFFDSITGDPGSGKAAWDWMTSEYGIKFLFNSATGFPVAARIPDDIYVLLMLKYAK